MTEASSPWTVWSPWRRRRLARMITLFGILPASLALLVAVLVSTGIQFGDVASALGRISPWFLVAAGAASLVELALRVARFRLMLRGMGFRVSFRSVLSAQLIGIFAGTVSPMRIGEPLKAVVLQRRDGVPAGVGVVAAVMERVLDLVILVFLFLLALTTTVGRLVPADPATVASIGVGLVVLYLALVYGIARGRLGRFLMQRFRPGGLVHRFALGVLEIRLPAVASVSWAVMSVVITLVDVSILYWILWGVGAPMDYLLVLALVGAGTLAGIASQVPGGIGTTEAVYVFLLNRIGVPAADALAAAVVSRLMSFYLFTLVGWVLLARTSVGLREAVAKT